MKSGTGIFAYGRMIATAPLLLVLSACGVVSTVATVGAAAVSVAGTAIGTTAAVGSAVVNTGVAVGSAIIGSGSGAKSEAANQERDSSGIVIKNPLAQP